MKIVQHPTNYVLIKAKTNSQWDSCDFAIIDVSGDWKKLMRSRLDRLESFSEDESFYNHAYWDEPTGFYIHRPEEDDELRIFLDGDEEPNCLFVTLEEADLENFTTPENGLEAHQLIIAATGQIFYRAYGEHTGEEFFTRSIDAYDLLIALRA